MKQMMRGEDSPGCNNNFTVLGFDDGVRRPRFCSGGVEFLCAKS